MRSPGEANGLIARSRDFAKPRHVGGRGPTCMEVNRSVLDPYYLNN
jgi:hypothetical protein